jgi:carbon storage regulator
MGTDGTQLRESIAGRLVLTRKPGDSVMIGDDIEVHLVQVGHGTARLAITAPREVPIRRGEPAQAKNAKRGNGKSGASRQPADSATGAAAAPAPRRRRRVVIERS